MGLKGLSHSIYRLLFFANLDHPQILKSYNNHLSLAPTKMDRHLIFINHSGNFRGRQKYRTYMYRQV